MAAIQCFFSHDMFDSTTHKELMRPPQTLSVLHLINNVGLFPLWLKEEMWGLSQLITQLIDKRANMCQALLIAWWIR